MIPFGRRFAGRHVLRLPRYGAMATMPSRAESFAVVLPAVAAQVDRLFLFLDGFADVPAPVRAVSNVVLLPGGGVDGLHAAGRFLALEAIAEDAALVVFDDDIRYPSGYVDAILRGLAAQGGRAVVGFHANDFRAPHESYARDRTCFHFADRLRRRRRVHCLGCGTSAFATAQLRFDPRAWTGRDMDDILLAIEAERRGLPRIALPRPARWLTPIGGVQADSAYARMLKDDSAHTAAARRLIASMAETARSPRRRAGALAAAKAS